MQRYKIMEDLEKTEQMISHLKRIKASIKKKQKMSDKLFETSNQDVTPKRMQKMNVDLNWECMNLDKEITGFARMFKGSFLDVETGEKEYRPSGFHTYKG